MAVIAAFALAVLPRVARASNLSCGDSLGAGQYVLEQDLTCPSGQNGNGFGLQLLSGAVLDMGGHTITMTISGSGTGLLINATGAVVHHGSLTAGFYGVLVDGGSDNRLYNLTVDANNIGLEVKGSIDNEVTDSEMSGNFIVGVVINGGKGNHFRKLNVSDNNGIGPAPGFTLVNATNNVITESRIDHNLCMDVYLNNSSQNTVCFNSIQDSFSIFSGPAIDVLVYGTSSENLICGNQLNATAPDASDGINIGCEGTCGCGFQQPTTGATRNLVLGNSADNEKRYGIAQATGNDQNVYFLNTATGNGVANYSIQP
jgi:parallel beta-helix repeat protein